MMRYVRVHPNESMERNTSELFSDDSVLLERFFARSEAAIAGLQAKYGARCEQIAGRILGSELDAEECVNDAYLVLWNRIPPERPNPLSAYLFRVVRNLALKRYHANAAAKRSPAYELLLDELAETIPAREDVESEVLAGELSDYVNAFLSSLAERDRVIFVRRYWYGDTPEELAKMFGLNVGTLNVRMHRIRARLRSYLAERWG